MPELPETETVARDLDAALRGAVIRRSIVVRPDVARGAALDQPRSPRYVGVPIARVFRRAKAIVIEFESATRFVVVPRFTGALLLSRTPLRAQPASAREVLAGHPYACVFFGLEDGRALQYVDIRRLGTLSLLTPEPYAAWDLSLGPEPLDPGPSPQEFSGILRGSRRAVKTVLMDQRKLAGVGNIYANEALFRAGIRPRRRAATLTRAESAKLLLALQSVLRESIALRGTTFRDFQDAYGNRGGFAAKLQVYGRGGEACVNCGHALQETHVLEGRSTVWCRTCQR